MNESFPGLEIEQSSLSCVECGKQIKSGHYYGGTGPYGLCCYKKLYGTEVLLKYKRRLPVFRKISKKGDKCPETGSIKECFECLFLNDCNYKKE